MNHSYNFFHSINGIARNWVIFFSMGFKPRYILASIQVNLNLGYYDSEPIINHEEVTNWKWMNLEEIIKEIKTTPDNYTAWFKIIFDRFYNHIKV